MICSAHCNDAPARAVPSGWPAPAVVPDPVRDRQMAALFLQAAALVQDPTLRERLRRRAARLIRRPATAAPA